MTTECSDLNPDCLEKRSLQKACLMASWRLFKKKTKFETVFRQNLFLFGVSNGLGNSNVLDVC